MFSPPSSTLAMLSLDSPTLPYSSHKRKRSTDSPNVPSSTALAQQPAKDSGLIRCICGYAEDDGLTIFCDMCGFWQHMSCVLGPSPSSSSQPDNADTTTDDDEGGHSSSSARSSSSKRKSRRPPVPALPEQWFCEICVPRPVDARSARARQTRRLQVDRDRELREAADVDVVGGRRRPRLDGDKRRKSSANTAPTPTESQKRTSKNGAAIHHRKSITGANGGHPTLSANSRRRSASVDVLLSPADEESLFEPWSNEYTRIPHDIIADDAVRASIRRWRISLERPTPSSYRDVVSPAISPLTACAPLLTPPLSKTTSCKFRVQVKPVPPSDCLPLPLPSVSSFHPYSTPSYHDKSASSDPSYKSASYSRPPTYGLYTAPVSSSASAPIPAGTLLTTYISHIIPVSAYTSAPLSQYSLLHLPKPHVRLIPAPLSLALDAREMGNESRFIRNGCHPNAVIRPVVDDTSPYGIVWGVYATKDIAIKGEEVVLGWEWDRDSAVHRLGDLLEYGCEDLQDETRVKAQMSQILTTLGGTFTSCACGRQQFGGVRDCVFAQMSRFVCDRSRFAGNGERAICASDEGPGIVSSMLTPVSSPSVLPTPALESTGGIKNKPAKRAKNGKTDLGPMVGWTAAEGPYVGIQGLSNGNGHIDAGSRSMTSSFPPTPSSPFLSTLKLPVPPSNSASVNSKAWASVVGLYDAPRPVTTSSNVSQFRSDPSSTSSDSVLISPSPRPQAPIYDRSNLPKISTSLPAPLPASSQQQQPQPQSYFPSMTGKPPSPRHWMSMSLASRGIANGASGVTTCPSPILESPETAMEEGDSYPFPVRSSPAPTSIAVSRDMGLVIIPPVAVAEECADVDVVMSEGGGHTATEHQCPDVADDDEPIKLPPKMQKRMKSSSCSGGQVSEASNTTGAGPLSGEVDADTNLMPPPLIPASLDPTTVTSIPIRSSPSSGRQSPVQLASSSIHPSPPSSPQSSESSASRIAVEEAPVPASPALQETAVVAEPKREPEPEHMSTPALTPMRRVSTPPPAPVPSDAPPAASRPAPAVRMSFLDWKQKRAQEKQGKDHKDVVVVKEETHEQRDQQSQDVNVSVKIEADVVDGSKLLAAIEEMKGSSTAPVNPQLHIDIPTIDLSSTGTSSTTTAPELVRTLVRSQPAPENVLPELVPALKTIPAEPPVEASVSWTSASSDSMDVDPKQPLDWCPLRKDSTNIMPPVPSLPPSSDSMDLDDDVKPGPTHSSTQTIRPAAKPDPTSLTIILPTPSPDAEDAEDGEIPPSPHDKLSPTSPVRTFTAPVPSELRRAPRSSTPLVHPPPPLPPIRRSPPSDRYRPSSPPRERRPPPPSRSYRPDPPPPSLNSYRPNSPADSTSSPSGSPRHHSNTWYDDPRGPSSTVRGSDRWYGSSWRVSSSHQHSAPVGGGGGPRPVGPRDHPRDRDYAPPHNFARGNWDSDRGGGGGRYMDWNRYPRDRDTREQIKQRGIEARAREAEVYKGRTAPPNPRGAP